MSSTVDLWTPPAGMSALDVKAWRSFYARNLDLYGITPAQYRMLYIAKMGRCCICRLAMGVHPYYPNAGGSRRLGVDHNHLTGAVRGLLCTGGDKTCNRIIGWLDAAALRRAADYLERGGPARALEWARLAEEAANEAGMGLDQWQLDTLAVAYLWPEYD